MVAYIPKVQHLNTETRNSKHKTPVDKTNSLCGLGISTSMLVTLDVCLLASNRCSPILVTSIPCRNNRYHRCGQTVSVCGTVVFPEKIHDRHAEYERFVYLFPGDERVSQSRYHIGMAYYAERRYAEAIRSFSDLVETEAVGSAYHARSFFMAAESQLRLGRRLSALTTLHNLATISDDTDVQDEANYRIGWIYLETADWEKAQSYFQKISHQNHAKYRLADLIRNLEGAGDIHHKSPGVAGALAILPGGGYLYCNRPRDALISFLLNGGLIFAAYEAFDNEMYALGGVISFVEIGFYSGSIYGSISSAHKYNRDQDRQVCRSSQGKPEDQPVFTAGKHGARTVASVPVLEILVRTLCTGT